MWSRGSIAFIEGSSCVPQQADGALSIARCRPDFFVLRGFLWISLNGPLRPLQNIKIRHCHGTRR